VTETFNSSETEEQAPLRSQEAAGLDERRAQIEKLLGKQMRNFTALFVKVVSSEDVDAVHDLRVCTRRFQQVLAALVPDKTLHKARGIRRTLRDVRRALGQWRNCDVALQWVSRTERRSLNPNRQRGWAMVRESIAAERKRVISRALRRLFKSDGLSLGQRTAQLIAMPAQRLGSMDPDSVMRTSISDASNECRIVLARATENRSVQNIHAFRIQLKRMRYRVELARNMGVAGTKPLIGWFKSLQDRLGHWHDRQELNRFITRALAHPDLLLKEPRAAAEMLKEVQKDIAVSAREVDSLFRIAVGSEGRRQFDDWIQSYCGIENSGSLDDSVAAAQADVIAEGQAAPAMPILTEPATEATDPTPPPEHPPATETSDHQLTTLQSNGEAKD
jgi:CHAD domain-containing protein